MIGTTELAKQRGVTRATIISWIQAGCPHIKTAGGQYRLDPEQVDSWVAKRCAELPAKGFAREKQAP